MIIKLDYNSMYSHSDSDFFLYSSLFRFTRDTLGLH